MKAEIITVGSELLLGQVMDTNTRYAARELARHGFEVYHHSTIGDNPERLQQAIVQAESRANLILLIGGLGPTKDDITREIVAEHTKRLLVKHQSSMKNLHKRFTENAESIPSGNLKMAQVINQAVDLPNETGSAIGNVIYEKEHIYAVLPGPPSECEPMIKHYLIPELVNKVTNNGVLRSKSWRLYGITEPATEIALEKLLLEQTNPSLAVYVEGGEIIVRSTAKADTVEEAEIMLTEMKIAVMENVGDYYFADNNETLPTVVMNLLIEKQVTLVLVEETTNGKVYQLLSRFENDFKTHIPAGLTLSVGQERPLVPVKTAIHLQDVFNTTLGVTVYESSAEKSKSVTTLAIRDKNTDISTCNLSTHFGQQTPDRLALEVLNKLRTYLLKN